MKQRLLLFAALVFFLASSVVTAQHLEISRLVRGEEATFAVSGMGNGDRAVFFLSLNGVGPGQAFRQFGVAMNVAGPNLALGNATANAEGEAAITIDVPPGAPLVDFWVQALVLPKDPTEGSVQLTPVEMGRIEGLSAFDDDFAQPMLDDQWRIHNGHKGQISVDNGELRIAPTVGGFADIWFNDSEGPLVSRLVRGDFTVVTTLRATNAAGTSAPLPSYNFGGVIFRDPASQAGSRNSVHAVLGAGVPSTPFAAEDKNTIDSTSNFILHPITTPAGQLRLTRAGDLVSAYYRSDAGASWQLLRSHVRPDFPETLEVGLMAYSFTLPTNIAVFFDDIRFYR